MRIPNENMVEKINKHFLLDNQSPTIPLDMRIDDDEMVG